MPELPFDAAGLALAAGLVAAVNPCGFALLPVYLSLFVLDENPSRTAAVVRALRATAAMTLGFAGVFAAFGLAVAPVASSVQRYLPGFTVLLGLTIAAAGLWVVTGRTLPGLRVRRPGRPGGRPVTSSLPSMVGFGASYAIASLGCTIAPFLAVVVTAFRAGSTAQGVAVFLAYAVGMSLVVGTAAVAVALARAGLVHRLRRAGGLLARPAGGLLVLAGGYVVWYGVWELRVLGAGSTTDPIVDTAAGVQQWLAGAVAWLGAGGFLGLLLALLATAALLGRHRRRSGEPRPAPALSWTETDPPTPEGHP